MTRRFHIQQVQEKEKKIILEVFCLAQVFLTGLGI